MEIGFTAEAQRPLRPTLRGLTLCEAKPRNLCFWQVFFAIFAALRETSFSGLVAARLRSVSLSGLRASAVKPQLHRRVLITCLTVRQKREVISLHLLGSSWSIRA